MEDPPKENEELTLKSYAAFLAGHYPAEKKSVVTKQANMTRYFRGNLHLSRSILKEMQNLGLASHFDDTVMSPLYTFDLDKIRKYAKKTKRKI